MSFDAVIFDLDGTLLDTLQDIADAANEVLEQQGFPGHSYDAYRLLVGAGVSVLFSRALPADAATPVNIAVCVARFREVYGHCWNQTSHPYDGIDELLHDLARRQIKMAILSNKPQQFTQQCADELLDAWRFQVVLGQRDGVPTKPDPTAALEIAARLAVAPARCLYVGDTSIDMETALRAGMYPVGVLWGFRSREELERSGAAVIIAHPRELLPLLAGPER